MKAVSIIQDSLDHCHHTVGQGRTDQGCSPDKRRPCHTLHKSWWLPTCLLPLIDLKAGPVVPLSDAHIPAIQDLQGELLSCHGCWDLQWPRRKRSAYLSPPLLSHNLAVIQGLSLPFGSWDARRVSLSGPDNHCVGRRSWHQPDTGSKQVLSLGWKPCSPGHLSLCQAQPDFSSPLASRSLAPTLMCCSVSAFFSSRYTVQMKSPACYEKIGLS